MFTILLHTVTFLPYMHYNADRCTIMQVMLGKPYTISDCQAGRQSPDCTVCAHLACGLLFLYDGNCWHDTCKAKSMPICADCYAVFLAFCHDILIPLLCFDSQSSHTIAPMPNAIYAYLPCIARITPWPITCYLNSHANNLAHFLHHAYIMPMLLHLIRN